MVTLRILFWLAPNWKVMFAAWKPVVGQAGIQVAAENGEIVHADDVVAAESPQFIRELFPIAGARSLTFWNSFSWSVKAA